MAAAPRRCRVPGCGLLSEGGSSRSAWMTRMCDFHQAAEAVELGGELWRFCRPCCELHSLHWFTGDEHVCRLHTGRPGPHAHRRDSMVRHVMNRHPGKAARRTGLMKMDPPWGQGLVDYIAGRTLTSKLSIPALYSAALWRLGCQHPATWAALGTTAAGLHALLPYLYKKHYVEPLRSLRKLAAKRRMSVSPALELITGNSEQLRLFEKMATQLSSGGWLRDGLMFVALLTCCSFRVYVSLKANGCGVWSAAPLVGGALLLVPLRARAISKGHHYARQWIDFTADLFCRAMQFGGILLDRALPPPMLVGISALGVHGFLLCMEVVTTLARSLVLEKRLRCIIASEAAVGAVVAGCLAPIALAKIAEAGELPASVYGQVPYSAAANLLLGGLLYTARRAQSEGRYLTAFLTSEVEKYEGPVLRPRLGMSTKLHGATPDDLPWDLREQMLRLPQEEVESLEGFIRPGCVLLTLSYRFGGAESLDTARAAVLASLRRHSSASNLPWAQMDAVVTVGDTRFTVEGGEVVKEEAVLSPVIIAVDQVAVFDAETATLEAMGLGSAPFSVMLRAGKDYSELEVVSEDMIESDVRLVTVRLPEFPDPGMAWLEVQSHASSSCPVISEGFPIMFTWNERLAEELSSCLLDRLPTVQHVASFLEDVAQHLSEGVLCRNPDDYPEVPPALVLEAMRLGLAECFRLLVRRADTLEAADRVPPGLLSVAIRSGSEELLEAAIDLLELYSLPTNPCRIHPGSFDGFSPLHLAAQQGNAHMVALLLDKAPTPERQWHTLTSRVGSRTPDELMRVVQPWFSVKAVIESLPSSQAEAVWGTEEVAALSFRTTTSRIGFPAAYSAVLWAVGWSEPLAVLTLALVMLGLHVLGPQLHKVYVQRLHNVREVAESCQLRVSQSLRILEPEVQHAYEQSELRRSPRPPLMNSLVLVALLLPTALFPCLESWKVSGYRRVEPWTVAQAVVVLGLLATLRTWAVKTGRLGSRQWVDLMAWNYCVMGLLCYRVYLWAIGSQACNLPTSFAEVEGDAIVASTFLLTRVGVVFVMKVLLVSGPVSRGAFLLEPLLEMVPILFIGSTVNAWCIRTLNGADMPFFLGVIGAAAWFLGNVCYMGLRLRSEADRLHSFLTGMRRNMAKAGQ